MAKKAANILGKNAANPTGLMALGAGAINTAPQRGQAPAFSGDSPPHLQHATNRLEGMDPFEGLGVKFPPSNPGGEPGPAGCESGFWYGIDKTHAPSRRIFNRPLQVLPNPAQLPFWLPQSPFGMQWRPGQLLPSK